MKKRPAVLLFAVMTLLVLIISLVAAVVLEMNKQERLTRTEDTLETVLTTTVEGFHLWLSEKAKLMSALGKERELVEIALDFLDLPRQDPEFLRTCDVQKTARAFFESREFEFGNTGFFIIAPNGISLGSRRDANVGAKNLIVQQRPDLFARTMAGETVFVPPIRSDVVVDGSTVTMFIMTPVRHEGRIIAAMTQRLIPHEDFSRIFKTGRIGKTGETYAFDNASRLVSESRFSEQLQEAGLISEKHEEVLKLLVRDPGGDLTKGYAPQGSPQSWPQTLMARQALQGVDWRGMKRYRDYRGVPVYGVWLWDDMLGLGIATEIDAAEALAPFHRMQWTVWGVLTLTFALVGIAFVMVSKVQIKAHTALARAHQALDEKVRERTAELTASKASAEAANKAKAEFLANMSHEIRTPMNAVIGFADLALRTPSLPKEAEDYCQNVLHSARSLLAIINDILDLSKIEAGKLELEKLCFNLKNMLKDAVHTLALEAEDKGLELRFHYDPKLPKCVSGDPTRLRQVIINLVGNAVKFTNEGWVALAAEAEVDGIHFTIKDTGIGMAPEQLSRIFDSFTQADGSTARKFGGTGLGTTISRRIVDAMKGRLWAESQEGVGSVFHIRVRLPQMECHSACVYQETPDEETAVSPRLFKVLLVEDNKLNAELIQLNLEEWQGHSLAWVGNGQQAVDAIKRGDQFDLALMDVHLPILNGLDATRAIRDWEKEHGGHLPIIALTASATLKEQERCWEAGVDGFVRKPVEMAVLLAEMERVVPAGKGRPNSSEPNDLNQETHVSLDQLGDGVDYAVGLKAWPSVDKYAAALVRFAKEHANDDEILWKYLEHGEFEKARLLMHTLKGLTLGLAEVTAAATIINEAVKAKDRQQAFGLLPSLTLALRKATEAIGRLNLSKTALQAPPAGEIDLDNVHFLAERLLGFFAIGETDDRLFAELSHRLQGHVPGVDVAELSAALDHFDHEKASALLKRILEKLPAKE